MIIAEKVPNSDIVRRTECQAYYFEFARSNQHDYTGGLTNRFSRIDGATKMRCGGNCSRYLGFVVD